MLKHLVDPLHPTREWPSEIKLKCEIGQVTLINLSPSKRYLAAGLADGALVILDSDVWSVIFRYKQHSMAIIGIKWSQDARYIVTVGSDWQVCIWDMSIKQVVRTKQLDFSPHAVTFDIESPFNMVIVYGNSIIAATISLDGQSDTFTKLDSPPDSDIASFSCVQTISSSVLAGGTSKGNIHFYQGSKVEKTLKLSTGGLRAIAYCPSRQFLAVACSDRAVRIFYLNEVGDINGDAINPEKIEVGHKFTDIGLQSQWNALTFSQDGEYLYAGSDIRYGAVSIWNVLTRVAVRQLRGNSERLTSLDFDQERVMLVGSGRESGAIFVWRADPPKAWGSLISDFENIPDIEVYQEKESDWDLPDREIVVSAETEVDVWTFPEPLTESVIPIDL